MSASPAPVQNIYSNRDLSWLKFNERVLEQATDLRVPLLERVRFLAIYSSNLDEFFMKRVGYLKRIISHSVPQVGADQQKPIELLSEIRQVVQKHLSARQAMYDKLRPELVKHGISFLKWDDLTDDEKKSAKDYFHLKVFPVLIPLAVDKAHPFPFLSNLSISLGIVLMHPKKGDTYFARVKIPDVLPQWVQIQTGKGKAATESQNGHRLIRLIDLISANLGELFPEMVVQNVMPFRVTRSAEVAETSDDVEDQLDLVEEELRLRRVANIVRFEHGKVQDQSIFQFLVSELELLDVDLYEIPGEVSYQSLFEIANLNIPELRYQPLLPSCPPGLKDESRDIFSLIREKDILVHHPYESFNDSVVRLIREATDDPNVLAIKMTLYRAGENNPLIPILIRAAEKGKQVVCVIELKARFDEARNIYWSEMLEKAGVHVVYGVIGKKIHTKTILIIRKEGDSYRFYSHIGTGNYNPSTAKMYTDLSLLTCDKRMGNELIEVFNFLTGLSLKKNYSKLLVAPVNMRKRFLAYIKREIEFQSTQQNGYILAKMNSLEDQEICDALYTASRAGVKIDLIIRGFCTLKPGVPGMSENIRVMSLIGRFLEHSRIYYFRRGAKDPLDGQFYISSADWMYRNLNNRIECAAPIEDLASKADCWSLLQAILQDQFQVWDLKDNGEYLLRGKAEGKSTYIAGRGVQEELMKKTKSELTK
jgi:polyphosphate kinase